MERKNGPLAVRKITRAAVLAIRDMGAREARARVGEMKKPVKKTVKRGKRKG